MAVVAEVVLVMVAVVVVVCNSPFTPSGPNECGELRL